MSTKTETKSVKSASKSETKFVNVHKVAFDKGFATFLKNAKTLRDVAQNLLQSAALAKVEDEGGSVGCSLMTKFVNEVGDTRALNITAVRNYLLWVFTPGAMEFDKEGAPKFDAAASALVWADNAFSGRTDTVDIEGKIRRVTRKITAVEVHTRLAACKWYDFNPAKPDSAYIAKAVRAGKSDLKAMKEGKYIPKDENEKTFYAELAALLEKHGLNK